MLSSQQLSAWKTLDLLIILYFSQLKTTDYFQAAENWMFQKCIWFTHSLCESCASWQEGLLYDLSFLSCHVLIFIFTFMECFCQLSLRYVHRTQVLKPQNHRMLGGIYGDLLAKPSSQLGPPIADLPGPCPDSFWTTPNKLVPKCADFVIYTCRMLRFWRTWEGLMSVYTTIYVCAWKILLKSKYSEVYMEFMKQANIIPLYKI